MNGWTLAMNSSFPLPLQRTIRDLLLWSAMWGAAASTDLQGQTWSAFRGPTGDGIATEADLPTTWSETENVRWKIEIPGVAWSQPIVVGDKVYVTTAVAENQPQPKVGEGGLGFNPFSGEGFARLTTGGQPPEQEYQWRLLRIDLASGALDWSKTFLVAKPPIATHRSNSYASETPVTNGGSVFVHVAMNGVYCFDLDGEVQWTTKLAVAPMIYGWGTGSSPIVLGKTLYVVCDNEKQSYLLALNTDNGEQRWRVERDEPSNWGTPYVWRNKHRTELVVSGGKMMRSYAPESGNLLWEFPGGGRSATTPVGNQELLFVGSVSRTSGARGTLVAIRAGGEGNLAANGEAIAWTQRRSAPEIASPLLHRDRLYTLQQQGGIVRCFRSADGEPIFHQRIPQAAGFTASPLASEAHVYFLDERGTTFVLNPSDQLDVVATNKLSGMFWSSPAAAAGKLLLRSDRHLICLGQ